MGQLLQLKVWGEYALFTRVEAKAERVSYPVLTPSAARGILEAVFWKPEFKWRVISIHVLKPIQYYSILRNEVASIVPGNIVTSRRDYVVNDDRQLRHSIMLRDVAYVITAEIILKEPTMENQMKYSSMFLRRASKGQCFHRPYLGTRECSLHFSLPNDDEKAISDTMDIGPMLFDIKFPTDSDQKAAYAIPYFFDAKLEKGVLHVPGHLYKEVHG
ncbi:type I-C CRISPR-associated protein Cas5 [Paenibacillaceae bacterium]|nr:type I-C CRISPR-associated protein Cas5 [Paenibacillaceae bacterium]